MFSPSSYFLFHPLLPQLHLLTSTSSSKYCFPQRTIACDFPSFIEMEAHFSVERQLQLLKVNIKHQEERIAIDPATPSFKLAKIDLADKIAELEALLEQAKRRHRRQRGHI